MLNVEIFTQLYLCAIAGLVPIKIVQCMATFLDFCYLARRSEHDTDILAVMNDALHHFPELRMVFVDLGVRETGVGLPRQHALIHYVHAIQQFGSPNGLCSSITESKHIDAVKQPWRHSNRNEPIGQMLRTLTRKAKLVAVCTEFGRRGMLHGDVLTSARLALGDDEVEDDQARRDARYRDALDVQAADGDRASAHISLSTVKAGTSAQ